MEEGRLRIEWKYQYFPINFLQTITTEYDIKSMEHISKEKLEREMDIQAK